MIFFLIFFMFRYIEVFETNASDMERAKRQFGGGGGGGRGGDRGRDRDHRGGGRLNEE